MTIKSRLVIFFAVVVAACAFLLPTIAPEQFGKGWISKPILLGLDLSGGVHLVYEVQSKEAVKSRLQTMATAVRAELRERKIALTRARVSEAQELELTLLSAQREAEAQQVVTEEFRDITYRQTIDEDGRRKLVYGFSPQQIQRIEAEAISQAVETLRNRVDQFGVAEPMIQRVGAERIMLQMPGVSDIEAVKRVVGSVAKLEFRIRAAGPGGRGIITLKDRQGMPIELEEDVLMTGDAVDTARVAVPDGRVEVMLNLTSEGRKTFARITTEHQQRQLAIILDGVVYSHPTINEPITGGSASISGGFTLAEAKELAVVLRAGALPAPLKVLEERTVGPTLGKESIRKGLLAIAVGFAAVLLFMVAYYRRSGWIAVASLALNIVLIVGVLSAFGATLTLPGLAGLALTIGMAVDSNVIIFERIRDELRNGVTRDAAVRAGFDKALSAILDSNVTTFLTGCILYYFGTGPIRGFAVSLCIGIVTTVYCATFASRLGFDLFRMQRGEKGLSI